MEATNVHNAVVVGAGTMGSGIAAHLAKAGYPTRENGAASAPSATRKDPAWAELGLRMTDTYAGGVKA